MILDSFKLDGDVALVTGGGRGLGRAMALALAEAGANVAVAGRDMANLETVCGEIEKLGREALPVQADAAKPEEMEPLVRRAAMAFRRIDILVNNAGTTFRAPAEEFPLEEWDRVMDVNLKSPFVLCQHVGKLMKEQGGGRIINMASLASQIGLSLIPPYVASKCGIAGLTRALAVEWAAHNIRVNAIGPGYFKTDLTAGLEDHPDRGPKIKLRIPMKRWGAPDDLKGAVVFLASRASAYVTGQLLFVDGGWMAG
jgi:2-dehydro-3-deoxy-D-gluconate 5-dehydrogenase